MIITKNGVELRNLEEQVLKNKQDIANHYNIDRVLADFGIKVVGTVTKAEDLEGIIGTAYGDAYAVGTEPPYSFYIWTRADANSGHPNDYWLDIGAIAIQGPEGPVGPTGPEGPEGSKGTIWKSGTTAPTNDTATRADDYYLNTTSGRVYRSASDGQGSYQWLDMGSIRGPQGIPGPQGERGFTGPQGPIGPQGPQGDVGGFINIWGVLDNVDLLPDPASLDNLTIAYLIGSAPPYILYAQIGESSDTARWENLGSLNAATYVLVDGVGQNVWDADTKVDKYTPTDGYMYGYAVTSYGAQYMVKITDTLIGNAIARRTVNGQLRAQNPVEQYDVVNKNYFDNNAVRWGNAAWPKNSVPAKDSSGASVYCGLATSPNALSIAQYDNSARLKTMDSPLPQDSSYDPYNAIPASQFFEYTNYKITRYKYRFPANSTASKSFAPILSYFKPGNIIRIYPEDGSFDTQFAIGNAGYFSANAMSYAEIIPLGSNFMYMEFVRGAKLETLETQMNVSPIIYPQSAKSTVQNIIVDIFEPVKDIPVLPI